MLSNRYGHFDPSGRAFRITDPNCPMPWVNVISNGRYGLVVSQNGGGFSWFDDAQHNVLTRWEMDLVRDCYGKFLYLTDLESNVLWTAAPAPIRPAYEQYSCTHTLGSTTFRTQHAGIATGWTLAVAPSDAVEVWAVEITNTTQRPRRLRVSSYFEWTCGAAPDAKREFHRLFFTTKHDAARRAIVATKNMWDIPPKHEREHWNQPWPYAAAHAICGPVLQNGFAIADKGAFLGRYGTTAAPVALRAPAMTGGFGRFGDACAALGGDLTLEPGASVTLHYLLAIAGDEAGVLKLIDTYAPPAAARDAVRGAGALWDGLLAPTDVQTERPDFDLLNNYWLPYQAIGGRLWGRTGYYQQSGAFGFRDQLQDSQVWLPLEPARCAEQIMLHATRQFADGSVNHWWHPLADFGNRTACSDDYLWLPFVVAAYLRETGDFGLLSRTAPFRDDSNKRVGEQSGTILDHCKRSFAKAFGRFTARGLPCIGSCDWNDGLSALGLEGKGESVWLAMFICRLLDEWKPILAHVKDPAGADFAARRARLAEAINTVAWDGGYYRGATKDSGEWIGASSSPEGKIHLNPQTWSILADVAPAERREAAWGAVKEHLLSPYGPLLLAPAYTTPDPDIGYITRYSPGSRENGGVYMHAATWALAAACKMRDVEAVGSIWRSISPAWRGQNADGYFAEPYVTPGNVDGPLSDKPGRAGWTWYTGSAAWLNRVSLEWVLGIRPTWEGLLIDPVPPGDLGKVSVVRTWRGRRIRVRFDAGEFSKDRPALVTVGGQGLPGGVLTEESLSAAAGEGGTVDVEVRWGAPVSVGPGRAAGSSAARA